MLMSKQWNLWPDYFKDNILYTNNVCNVIYETSIWDWEQSIDIIYDYCIGDYLLQVWDYNKMCYVRSFIMADGRQQCPSHQLYGKVKDHLYTPYSAKFYQ